MSLKTFGGRTFAALAFAVVTLHGADTAPIPGGGEQISSGSGGGRVTFGNKRYTGHEGGGRLQPFVVEIDKQVLDQEDEETVVTTVLAQAILHYYT